MKMRFLAFLLLFLLPLNAEEKPLVIFLNGTSSAGKTSIAHQIQELSEQSFLYAGIDLYIMMLPSSYLPDGKNAKLGFTVIEEPGPKRLVEHGPIARQLIYAMHRSMKTMLDNQFNLILDEVLVSDEEFKDYLELFKDVQVLFVGVRTPLEVAEQREKARGDRLLGFARGFYDRVHKGKNYDLEIDTCIHTPEESARIILNYLSMHPKLTAFQSHMLYPS